MHITPLEYLIWTAVTLGDILLLIIMGRKKLWRRFPFFFTYTSFDLLRELAGVPMLLIWPQYYAPFYISVMIMGAMIHFGLLGEICIHLIRPPQAISKSILYTGAILASLITMAVLAFSTTMPMDMAAGSKRFISSTNFVLTCLRFTLFAYIAAFSSVLGLTWRHYIFGIAAGLGIYSCVDLITTTMNVLFNVPGAHALHQLSNFSYLLAMAAWCYVLAKDEPALSITPGVRSLLFQLKDKFEVFNQIVGARK